MDAVDGMAAIDELEGWRVDEPLLSTPGGSVVVPSAAPTRPLAPRTDVPTSARAAAAPAPASAAAMTPAPSAGPPPPTTAAAAAAARTAKGFADSEAFFQSLGLGAIAATTTLPRPTRRPYAKNKFLALLDDAIPPAAASSSTTALAASAPAVPPPPASAPMAAAPRPQPVVALRPPASHPPAAAPPAPAGPSSSTPREPAFGGQPPASQALLPSSAAAVAPVLAAPGPPRSGAIAPWGAPPVPPVPPVPASAVAPPVARADVEGWPADTIDFELPTAELTQPAMPIQAEAARETASQGLTGAPLAPPPSALHPPPRHASTAPGGPPSSSDPATSGAAAGGSMPPPPSAAMTPVPPVPSAPPPRSPLRSPRRDAGSPAAPPLSGSAPVAETAAVPSTHYSGPLDDTPSKPLSSGSSQHRAAPPSHGGSEHRPSPPESASTGWDMPVGSNASSNGWDVIDPVEAAAGTDEHDAAADVLHATTRGMMTTAASTASTTTMTTPAAAAASPSAPPTISAPPASMDPPPPTPLPVLSEGGTHDASTHPQSLIHRTQARLPPSRRRSAAGPSPPHAPSTVAWHVPPIDEASTAFPAAAFPEAFPPPVPVPDLSSQDSWAPITNAEADAALEATQSGAAPVSGSASYADQRESNGTAATAADPAAATNATASQTTFYGDPTDGCGVSSPGGAGAAAAVAAAAPFVRHSPEAHSSADPPLTDGPALAASWVESTSAYEPVAPPWTGGHHAAMPAVEAPPQPQHQAQPSSVSYADNVAGAGMASTLSTETEAPTADGAPLHWESQGDVPTSLWASYPVPSSEPQLEVSDEAPPALQPELQRELMPVPQQEPPMWPSNPVVADGGAPESQMLRPPPPDAGIFGASDDTEQPTQPAAFPVASSSAPPDAAPAVDHPVPSIVAEPAADQPSDAANVGDIAPPTSTVSASADPLAALMGLPISSSSPLSPPLGSAAWAPFPTATATALQQSPPPPVVPAATSSVPAATAPVASMTTAPSTAVIAPPPAPATASAVLAYPGMTTYGAMASPLDLASKLPPVSLMPPPTASSLVPAAASASAAMSRPVGMVPSTLFDFDDAPVAVVTPAASAAAGSASATIAALSPPVAPSHAHPSPPAVPAGPPAAFAAPVQTAPEALVVSEAPGASEPSSLLRPDRPDGKHETVAAANLQVSASEPTASSGYDPAASAGYDAPGYDPTSGYAACGANNGYRAVEGAAIPNEELRGAADPTYAGYDDTQQRYDGSGTAYDGEIPIATETTPVYNDPTQQPPSSQSPPQQDPSAAYGYYGDQQPQPQQQQPQQLAPSGAALTDSVHADAPSGVDASDGGGDATLAVSYPHEGYTTESYPGYEAEETTDLDMAPTAAEDPLVDMAGSTDVPPTEATEPLPETYDGATDVAPASHASDAPAAATGATGGDAAAAGSGADAAATAPPAASKPKHCTNCGSPAMAGANFCGECGHRLIKAPSPQIEPLPAAAVAPATEGASGSLADGAQEGDGRAASGPVPQPVLSKLLGPAAPHVVRASSPLRYTLGADDKQDETAYSADPTSEVAQDTAAYGAYEGTYEGTYDGQYGGQYDAPYDSSYNETSATQQQAQQQPQQDPLADGLYDQHGYTPYQEGYDQSAYPVPAYDPNAYDPSTYEPAYQGQGYDAQRGPYDAQPDSYDAQQGQYDAQQGQYDAQQGQYDAQQGQYDAQQGPYDAQEGQYDSSQYDPNYATSYDPNAAYQQGYYDEQQLHEPLQEPPLPDEPAVPTDPLGRLRGHAVVCFGFGGYLITTFPTRQKRFTLNASGGTDEVDITLPGLVTFQTLPTAYPMSVAPFPPLGGAVSSKARRKELLAFIDRKLANPIMASNDAPAMLTRRLIWSLMKLTLELDTTLWDPKSKEKRTATLKTLLQDFERQLQYYEQGARRRSSRSASTTHRPASAFAVSSSSTSSAAQTPQGYLEELLKQGHLAEAHQYAVVHQQYDHALLLAKALPPAALSYTVTTFNQALLSHAAASLPAAAAEATVADPTATATNTDATGSGPQVTPRWATADSPLLRIIYMLMAGHPQAAATAGPTPAAASEETATPLPTDGNTAVAATSPVPTPMTQAAREEEVAQERRLWLNVLRTVILCHLEGDLSFLAMYGDTLKAQGHYLAAQVYYLLATSYVNFFGPPDQIETRFTTVGSDLHLQPTTYFRDLEALEMTFVYDGVLAVKSSASEGHPHIHGLRLVYTMILLDHGLIKAAREQLEPLRDAVQSAKPHPYINRFLLETTEVLAHRVALSVAGAHVGGSDERSSWFKSKGGFRGILERSANKVMNNVIGLDGRDALLERTPSESSHGSSAFPSNPENGPMPKRGPMAAVARPWALDDDGAPFNSATPMSGQQDGPEDTAYPNPGAAPPPAESHSNLHALHPSDSFATVSNLSDAHGHGYRSGLHAAAASRAPPTSSSSAAAAAAGASAMGRSLYDPPSGSASVSSMRMSASHGDPSMEAINRGPPYASHDTMDESRGELNETSYGNSYGSNEYGWSESRDSQNAMMAPPLSAGGDSHRNDVTTPLTATAGESAAAASAAARRHGDRPTQPLSFATPEIRQHQLPFANGASNELRRPLNTSVFSSPPAHGVSELNQFSSTEMPPLDDRISTPVAMVPDDDFGFGSASSMPPSASRGPPASSYANTSQAPPVSASSTSAPYGAMMSPLPAHASLLPPGQGSPPAPRPASPPVPLPPPARDAMSTAPATPTATMRQDTDAGSASASDTGSDKKGWRIGSVFGLLSRRGTPVDDKKDGPIKANLGASKPALIFDPVKKKWVKVDASGEDEPEKVLAPPPTMPLMRPMAPPGGDGDGAIDPSALSSDQGRASDPLLAVRRPAKRGARSRYVDVVNPDSHTRRSGPDLSLSAFLPAPLATPDAASTMKIFARPAAASSASTASASPASVAVAAAARPHPGQGQGQSQSQGQGQGQSQSQSQGQGQGQGQSQGQSQGQGQGQRPGPRPVPAAAQLQRVAARPQAAGRPAGPMAAASAAMPVFGPPGHPRLHPAGGSGVPPPPGAAMSRKPASGSLLPDL